MCTLVLMSRAITSAPFSAMLCASRPFPHPASRMVFPFRSVGVMLNAFINRVILFSGFNPGHVSSDSSVTSFHCSL